MEFSKTGRLIDGVKVKKLKKITTYNHDGKENGWLIDVLRSTDDIKEDSKNFSQIYVTVAYPGMVKGFHWHKTKVDLFFTIKGTVKLILVDDRERSQTCGSVNEFTLGEEGEYMVVKVPIFVKHALKNVGKSDAYVLNYMNPAYDSKNPDTYEWDGYEIN